MIYTEGRSWLHTGTATGRSIGDTESDIAADDDVRSTTDAVVGVALDSQVRHAAAGTLDVVDASSPSTTARPLDPRVLCRWVAVGPALKSHRADAVSSRHVRRYWSHGVCNKWRQTTSTLNVNSRRLSEVDITYTTPFATERWQRI